MMGPRRAAVLFLVGCYDPHTSAGVPSECPAVTAGCTAFACEGLGSCYEACPGPFDLDGASAACQGWGGPSSSTLVVIDSLAENECVFRRIVAPPASGAWYDGSWIGYQQEAGAAAPDQGWSWVYPSEASFVNWYAGTSSLHAGPDEPNDVSGDERCAYMFQGEELEGGWADVMCVVSSITIGAVCEAHP